MSFLLSSQSKVQQAITVWNKESRDAFNNINYDEPYTIQGIWQDTDTIVTTPSSKERIDESFLHTDEVIPVGSWVAKGTWVLDTPPDEAKEVVFVREMRFSHTKKVTYRYSL